MCSRCGEIKKVQCYTTTAVDRFGATFSKCDTKCTQMLPCGHTCIGNCYQWYVLLKSFIVQRSSVCFLESFKFNLVQFSSQLSV